MRHIHVSEPQLTDLTKPVVAHELVARALLETCYPFRVSLGMRIPDPTIQGISASVERVVSAYGPFV